MDKNRAALKPPRKRADEETREAASIRGQRSEVELVWIKREAAVELLFDEKLHVQRSELFILFLMFISSKRRATSSFHPLLADDVAHVFYLDQFVLAAIMWNKTQALQSNRTKAALALQQRDRQLSGTTSCSSNSETCTNNS